jgi:hypothetical protein
MWNKKCIKILLILLTYDYIPFLGLLQLKTQAKNKVPT